MSKKITREIIQTKVHAVTVEVVDGVVTTSPIQSLENVVNENKESVIIKNDYVLFSGAISSEKAQKTLTKSYGVPVTVVSTEEFAQRYEMLLETFIEHATLITE